MSFKLSLLDLINKDPKINTEFSPIEKKGDPLHVYRKQQQRAISDAYISICIAYGLKQRTYQDWSYTITDRSLKGTIYSKYIDKLRGLTVIGSWKDETFYINTTFWNFSIKDKKRF